jgi:hypothetical protein
VPAAITAAAVLAVVSLSLATWITPALSGVVLLYGLIQVGYCFQLKRMPLLDLFCIASGFLLRAIAGVVAGGFGFSPWFLLTVGLLALFLAIEKRKAELRVAQDLGVIYSRKVLERYSLPLLLRLESLVATSAFMSYSLWAAGPALNGASTTWMLVTVPFALVGIFRYQLLSDPDITREKILQMLPTLTLGCGAVAAVLCHDSISNGGHAFVGGVARSASQHHQLCIGNGDFSVGQGDEIAPIMTSDAAQLMIAAAKLGGRAFPDVTAALGWSKEHVDHVFCHQVGRQVNEAFYREMGLDFDKDFAIYNRYGNMVSAALPAALAIGAEEKKIQPGEKVLLTAFGSGLNARFLGFEW